MAPVAELVLIRHGQARYGEADYDRLSMRGHEQARHVGIALTQSVPARVFTGPMRRQVETYAGARAAAAAAGVALPEPEVWPELAEYPAFELIAALGPRLAELPEFAQADRNDPRARERGFEALLLRWASGQWNAPGIETAAQFAQRVGHGVAKAMAAARSGQQVALVTSAGPIAVAIGLTMGASELRMISLSRVVQNASFSRLRFRSEQAAQASAASMVTFNHTGHLPPELVTER